MQSTIAPQFQQEADIDEADAILRSCVHCGFCTATCPTYQLLGDELDGPRGRIYLIKEVLAGAPASVETLTHLDRCLTCRACESTCPSGVRYARLAEIGRRVLERQVPRPAAEQLLRAALRALLPYPERLRPLLRLGQWAKPWLTASWARQIPDPVPDGAPLPTPTGRRVIALAGCVQSVATPQTLQALGQVLQRLGVSLQMPPSAGCCGAVSLHLNAEAEAQAFMRRNIDAWWPLLEAGAEAILVSASGCGILVKEYGQALQHDPDYAHKATRVAALARDPAEWILEQDITLPWSGAASGRVAFQAPCSLQHGQQITGAVEALLQQAGYTLTPVADAHLCCGSAGTYSLLQPRLAEALRAAKLSALAAGAPDCMATANVGCQLHLQQATQVPVRHWLELCAEALAPVSSN